MFFFIFRFPFDRQTCIVKFHIKGVTTDEAYFTLPEETVKFGYNPSNEWLQNLPLKKEIQSINFSVKRNGVSDWEYQVSQYDVTITLDRAYSFYVANMIVPAVILNIIGTLSFFLPNSCGILTIYIINSFYNIIILRISLVFKGSTIY